LLSGCNTSKSVQNSNTLKTPIQSQETKKQVIDDITLTKFNNDILIVDGYIKEIKYDLAKQKLDEMALSFSDCEELGNKIVEKINDIENTNEKSKFSEYVKGYNEGYYYDTMLNLNKIKNGSLNYNEAQELMKKCKDALKTKVDKRFLEAENLYNNKKYEEVYYKLDVFVGENSFIFIKDIKLYNYNKIVDLYNKCEKELAPIYLSQGKKFYNEGKYAPAQSKLFLAETFAKNINLKSLEKEIDKYIQLTLEKDSISLSTPLTSYTSDTPPAIGMSAEEVKKSSWGEPKTINKTTTTYGISEQWVYFGNRYVYLENGVVTAIQESN
jgi:hypothetical protein